MAAIPTWEIEAESLTWKAVKSWAEKQIESTQALLERPGSPHDETERARGGLAALRQLVKLAEPKPDIQSGGDY
jgi:hypothetical protein